MSNNNNRQQQLPQDHSQPEATTSNWTYSASPSGSLESFSPPRMAHNHSRTGSPSSDSSATRRMGREAHSPEGSRNPSRERGGGGQSDADAELVFMSGTTASPLKRFSSGDSLRQAGSNKLQQEGKQAGLAAINTHHLHPSSNSSSNSHGPPSNSSSTASSPRFSLLSHQLQQHSQQQLSAPYHHRNRSSPSPEDKSPRSPGFPPPDRSPTTSTSTPGGGGVSGSNSLSHQPHGSPRRNNSKEDRERDRERERPPPSRQLSGSERPLGGASTAALGQVCAKCEQPMSGQFVRALGAVYHLDCFRCQDCSKVVASKFFPVDGADGRQYPLCETDYFRRLGLLCTKCGCALRGSYITALDMKFHVEHFTCSVCPTVFGPQDSYYEHAGSVYCHFHYSTRFAVKCTGCRTAILKQFVEINRNSTDEHWHPECYMIHKFWNIKLSPSPTPPALDTSEQSSTVVSPQDSPSAVPHESSRDATGPPSKALEPSDYLEQEELETPHSLKERQRLMEQQVYRIWTVLSAFEESSAACISEMLRHVSGGQYIEGVRMAEKFVLHVETLFSAIDDLSAQFKLAGAKEISHVREARMLCKKVVNFFSLLSHTHEAGARKMSITQELLSLVTGLAHYLKILIRIALTAALKLEREHQNTTAISQFLNRLDRLARDPEASKLAPLSSSNHQTNGETVIPRSYGYKSLTRAVGTLVGQGEATTDLCEGCKLTVEEECARFGTSLRWHLPCLTCSQCGNKQASKDKDPPPPTAEGQLVSIYLKEFSLEPLSQTGSGGDELWQVGKPLKGGKTFCRDCAPKGAREGFEYVTKLEQYAFLLCVALNKLYALLKQKGVVPSSPSESEEMGTESSERSLYDAYRDSTDIKRMKSVNLDRKLSSTTARIPKRSTVIQSPAGRVAQPNDASNFAKPPVPSRKDQPILDPSRAATVPRPSVPTLPQSYRSLPPDSAPSPNPGGRPPYLRATTQVRIIDEQGPDQFQHQLDAPILGAPSQDEKGITLADLPHVMEAEQRRFASPRTGTLLSELSALEYFIVKHVAALMLSSENSPFKDVVPLDELLDIIDARKNTFWGKLFKGGNEKKNVKKKGVFGIPLDVLVERNGADSMHGAGPGSVRVPSFVDDVISAMKQMDMSVEGVFRKNGNIRRLRDLTEALDRDSGSVNLSDDNPVQLAALLKKFLRDLPDPLMTFKLFQLFLATQRIENLDERKKTMHLVCCLMPKPHRDTMEVIFVFLKWVASFSHVDEETGSKMDLQNLATVICPNILYSKGKDPYKDESFSAVRAVLELLEYQDEFWMVPEEFAAILSDQDLFSNPSQLTSKEILQRAEGYVRKARRPGAAGAPSIPTRGEVHPLRPDLQQAWSAPAVSSPRAGGAGSNLRPNERPISFSTYAPNGTPIPGPLQIPSYKQPPSANRSLPGSPGIPPPRQGSPTPDPFRRPRNGNEPPRSQQPVPIACGNPR